MVLPTPLKHVETARELQELISRQENVMVCCGRMGPMCIPVYGAMEELQSETAYSNVDFRDMAFDAPEADVIRSLPECAGFRGLPFVVYFKKGKVAHATSSIQSKEQIKAVLDKVF